MSYLDYDEYFETKISRSYGNTYFGLFTGFAIFFIGFADVVVTLIDLFKTNYNQNGAQTNNLYVYTWDENPLWSTYGKGLWVGIFVSNN